LAWSQRNFTTFYKKKGLFQIALSSLPQSKFLSNHIVTSTTHVPALEMLGVENTLVGFPNTDYISSEKHENALMQER
jgi:iron complex transport system substrate-binding protein